MDLGLNRVLDAAHAARSLASTGIIRPLRPDKVARLALTIGRWGPTPAAGYMASAIVSPERVALRDELGELTFGELHRQSNALAHGLGDAGVREGDGIAILCRNHRGFIQAAVAASKLGAHALYLNTSFAQPQITDVCARERPVALVYDEEFHALCADAAQDRACFMAWHDGDADRGCPTLAELIAVGDRSDLAPPSEPGRAVILTSGTTGAPKGAARKQPDSMAPAAALFSKIPFRVEETTVIAAPMFHSWGFAHFTLGLALASELVLHRRFEPEATLAAIEETRATVLAVVPVMLQRILDLDDEVLDRYDTSSLRIIAASGSALPGELATRTMDRFGDVLYNLYGSTEVAWATIATPAELRDAPGTAGTPPRGTIVKLFDAEGNEVGPGETGRIFVGNEMLFDGYTTGGKKDVIDGLMSTGDVGSLDPAGRLFVSGRDDEMIVSGGENVFPREIEDLLASHPAVLEVALIGVPDDRFGQRLRAFVVKRPGAELTDDDVRAHVKSNLARFKVPRDVVFLEELPRNATGKVLKRELHELEA